MAMQIKDLKTRPETIKLLEENIRTKLFNIGLGNDFLGMTPKAQATEAKINKAVLHQTKKFLHSERSNQQNEKAIYRENICKPSI